MPNTDRPIACLPADLAPGDAKSRGLPVEDLEIDCIQSSEHPLFPMAYQRLWSEFGPRHEMEPGEVIRRRLAWHPARAMGDCWLRYEMMLVRRGGELAAVRDHTAVAVIRPGAARVVVHLSHVLVEPAWRRTGLAGWLRAWPIQTARACLAAGRCRTDAPITLVAEMEHPADESPNPWIRLKAYEKAGFKKVDPGAVRYFQPDFRPPAEIDSSGGPKPLPFSLVVRRVGLEGEDSIPGAEIRDIVRALYQMYGAGFRQQDMAGLWASLRDYPSPDAGIALVAPTR